MYYIVALYDVDMALSRHGSGRYSVFVLFEYFLICKMEITIAPVPRTRIYFWWECKLVKVLCNLVGFTKTKNE